MTGAGTKAGARGHRDQFEGAGNRAEELRTLPHDAVATLRELGLFWLKTPAELGGTPLSPIEFGEVIEELAYIDTSTAWAAMIGAFKADDACGDGGAAGTGFGRMVVFLVPKAAAEVIDNWHVAGLQGTGSLDFSLDGVFVPEELTYDLGSPAVRGGDLFRLEMPAFVSNEVPPLAIGLGRRAIDDMIELATRTARFPGGPTVSERAVFHKELGRAETRVRAARAVHAEAMAAAWESAKAGATPPEEQQLAVTTASVYAVETCADVVGDLFRYGGARALALSNPMQRHLRNSLAARQHVALSEENYETAGRYLLESAKARRP